MCLPDIENQDGGYISKGEVAECLPKTISMKRLPFGSDTMALRSVRIMKIPNEFALVIKIALCNTLCLLRVLLCVVVYCWACLRACNLIYVLFWCAYILSILLCPANQTVEPNAV